MLREIVFLMSVATGFCILWMLVDWWLAWRINNLGIVDIAWSYGFLPVAIFFGAAAMGDPTRRGLAAGMGALWSLRLGTHVAVRVIKAHPEEDARYGKLRANWGTNLKQKTFWFFEIQALSIAALSFVFLVPCLNPSPGITPLEWAGVAVWVVGVLGESLADRQLQAFKRKPHDKKEICRLGLWNYSRHPNYFFEWIVWMGFFLFAWDSPGGCYTVFCPALILYFLLRVTGIPLTEKVSLERKGESFREYQRTTSAFVPWFKKKTRSGH